MESAQELGERNNVRIYESWNKLSSFNLELELLHRQPKELGDSDILHLVSIDSQSKVLEPEGNIYVWFLTSWK